MSDKVREALSPKGEQGIDRENDQFNQGVLHTVDMLAKVLDVAHYVGGDGSEDYDEDLQQTLMNILIAKGLYDNEDGSFARLSRPVTVEEVAAQARKDTLEEVAKLIDSSGASLAAAIEETASEFGEDEAAKLARERVLAYQSAVTAIRALPASPSPSKAEG